MNQAILYSKYNGIQRHDAKYIIDNFIELVNWKDQELILDIGCGDGFVMLEFLRPNVPKNFEKLMGADVSEEMVKFAKKNWQNDDRIDFVRLDIGAKTVPFRQEFNHIFSFYCLHWILEQRQAFKNIYDMLKPGGEMLLTFLATNPIYDIYETMAKSNKWGPYMKNYQKFISPYHHSQNPDLDLEEILKNQGFNAHLCKTISRSYVFPSFAVLSKTVLAINPFIENLPKNEVDNFIADYVKEVRCTKYVTVETSNSNNNVEEKIHLTYKLFVVFASKPS